MKIQSKFKNLVSTAAAVLMVVGGVIAVGGALTGVIGGATATARGMYGPLGAVIF